MPTGRPIEQLAAALQGCLDEAARKGADEAIKRLEPRLDRQDETIRHLGARVDARLNRQDEAIGQLREHVDARLDRQDGAIAQLREHVDRRLDRQDGTLRLVWKQVKGNGRLPIDEP